MSESRPADTNPTVSTVVTEDDWITAVTAPPVAAPSKRFDESRASAQRIGLIDAATGEQVEAAGNTALLGAKLALFGRVGEEDDRSEIGEISGRVEHVSLAADPKFQEVFVDELGFP